MAIQEETGPVLVTVFCDGCGVEETHDYLVPAGMDSIAVARRVLKEKHGWVTGAWDYCPGCHTRPAEPPTESV